DPAGERVLLARVVAAQQRYGRSLVRDRDLDAVAEARTAARQGVAGLLERGPHRLPGEAAERDHDPDVRRHQRDLTGQPREAGGLLLHQRLVRRGRAAHRRHHPGADQLLAVAGVRAGRLGGQAGAVERGEQPVAAAVAGEDPAGAVAAVRGGGQADDEHARVLVAPPGDGTPPVRLVGEGAALDLGHLLAPGDQARAGPADRLPGRELGQRAAGRRELAHVRGVAGDRGGGGGRVVGPSGAGRNEAHVFDGAGWAGPLRTGDPETRKHRNPGDTEAPRNRKTGQRHGETPPGPQIDRSGRLLSLRGLHLRGRRRRRRLRRGVPRGVPLLLRELRELRGLRGLRRGVLRELRKVVRRLAGGEGTRLGGAVLGAVGRQADGAAVLRRTRQGGVQRHELRTATT